MLGCDNNTGIASSEVAKNTAINVPSVITLPENRLEAVTEKPHCGKHPKSAPTAGPYLPDLLRVFSIFFDDLCSIYYINKYDKNKKGKSFIPSIKVSKIISNIFSSKCK